MKTGMTFREKMVNCCNEVNHTLIKPEQVDHIEINSNKVVIRRWIGKVLTSESLPAFKILRYFGYYPKKEQRNEAQ